MTVFKNLFPTFFYTTEMIVAGFGSFYNRYWIIFHHYLSCGRKGEPCKDRTVTYIKGLTFNKQEKFEESVVRMVPQHTFLSGKYKVTQRQM